MAFKKKAQENVQPAPAGVAGKEVDAVVETPPAEQQPRLIKGIERVVFLNGKNQSVTVVEDFPDSKKCSVTAKMEYDECELRVIDGKKIVKLKEGKSFAERRPASNNPILAKPIEE